jgi:hypothetical protein
MFYRSGPGGVSRPVNPNSPDPNNHHNSISLQFFEASLDQELRSHKTLAMTQRYSHLAAEQLQNAV